MWCLVMGLVITFQPGGSVVLRKLVALGSFLNEFVPTHPFPCLGLGVREWWADTGSLLTLNW